MARDPTSNRHGMILPRHRTLGIAIAFFHQNFSEMMLGDSRYECLRTSFLPIPTLTEQISFVPPARGSLSTSCPGLPSTSHA